MYVTKFALEQLFVPINDGRKIEFWFDGNSKITDGNGSFDNPVANAFSLIQIADCPYATPTCQSVCYVNRLEIAETEVHSKYHINSVSIREILKKPRDLVYTATVFSRWIEENCPAGFRWHVSGDIFSLEYAYFISLVCELIPEIPFWIYTRSFKYLEPLYGIKNLMVNLSADVDNFTEAIKFHKTYDFRICYLTVDGSLPDVLPDNSVIFPAHNLRGQYLDKPFESSWWQSLTLDQRKIVCPADFFGQSPSRRCGPCQKCLQPKKDRIND